MGGEHANIKFNLSMFTSQKYDGEIKDSVKMEFEDDCGTATEAHFIQADMFATIGQIPRRAYGDISLSCMSTFISLASFSRWVL